MTISSAASSGNGNGADINMVAFANADGSKGGQVLLGPGSTVNSNGLGSGNNGNIQIIAGSCAPTAVSTRSLNSAGGSGTGGNITIATTQPSITGGSGCG